MTRRKRIRMAMQKNGRLSEKSTSLLGRCGLEFGWSKDRLFSKCENFPLDLTLVRDDDIPEYVCDGVCELGVVGLNVLKEKLLARGADKPGRARVLRRLGFGHCRLSLAVPADRPYRGVRSLKGTRIATSYPATLREFLRKSKVEADIVEISGSVEIATTLDIADCVCDLVSTGTTLRSNGLKEVETVFESECVLARTGLPLSAGQERTAARLLQRIDGVMRAADAKYIMLNAPADALSSLKKVLPGMEEPTIIPLGGDGKRVAVHAVAYEPVFWETMERLKAAGASSILVVPIEKIIA
ncbi:MAG: ATP phosphoribosyltransferase [Elusimicrobiota bacterium]